MTRGYRLATTFLSELKVSQKVVNGLFILPDGSFTSLLKEHYDQWNKFGETIWTYTGYKIAYCDRTCKEDLENIAFYRTKNTGTTGQTVTNKIILTADMVRMLSQSLESANQDISKCFCGTAAVGKFMEDHVNGIYCDGCGMSMEMPVGCATYSREDLIESWNFMVEYRAQRDLDEKANSFTNPYPYNKDVL